MMKAIAPEPVCSQEQTERAVAAVKNQEMLYRDAANSFGVGRSSLHRRVTEKVPLNAKPGPGPILTEGEVKGVLGAVDASAKRDLCFTRAELGMFIRQAVEKSPRKAQSFEVCRTEDSTVEHVDYHFNSLKKVMESCEDLPPSRIWNLDETGMSGQVSGAKPKVLASKGYWANVRQSDSRENVSTLVCGNADGGFVPPFIIFPGLSYDRTHTHGGYPNSKYASRPSSFLVTIIFVQYFEWFVNGIPPERPRDINAQIVSGACLMTSDESFEYHVAKAKEKADKLREKEFKAQVKVAKAKEHQDKKVAKLVADELKRRKKIELALAAEQK
ncbi:unnamed protein product [Phytophthora fragariaefolia]|uniref:Unnamed protein product n=1 Tax=Phytophthora fragariaefolia TaxID=1490495 RepID=A0A9W7D7X1_9STRA|nr:unnamed protein product [Phytophthora fragariaefolia]